MEYHAVPFGSRLRYRKKEARARLRATRPGALKPEAATARTMKDQVYHQLGKHARSHWWQRHRRHVVSDRLARLGVRRDGKSRVLEIGCGVGSECDFLSSYGPVTGVELSEVGLEYCRDCDYASLEHGDLNSYEPPPGQFDLLVDFNVLYHQWVEDPVAVLGRLREGLVPGG